MRSTRKQPFCWQEKKITRLIREQYKKSMRSKMLLLYVTITEIDSDFNGKDIKYYTKTISTYSGLSKDFIPTGLKYLEKLGIIILEEDRENGKFKGKRINFTPENVEEMPRKTIAVKPTNGKPLNEKNEPSEDSIIIEDSKDKEDNIIQAELVDDKNSSSKEPNQINTLIDKFKPINPSCYKLFPNKGQRNALDRMIKKHGFEELSKLLDALPDILSKKYSPNITTPVALENKLGDLMMFIKKNNKKGYIEV